MKPLLINTTLAPHLGQYEATFKDGSVHVWEVYYEYGDQQKAVFRMRWGRKGAKKMQQKSVSHDEVCTKLAHLYDKGFKKSGKQVTTWAEYEQKMLQEIVGSTEARGGKRRL